MEINRLKPMVENYDQQMFNRLFQRTENLRRKLASQIDCRRFGVDKDEILSYFSTKFIYVFNKYCQVHNEEVLLGHLIKAMQIFKFRVLRNAYTFKNSQTIISASDIDLESTFVENPLEPKPNHYETFLHFIKDKISDNAYVLLEVQFNPPPYILERLIERGIENIHKIPDEVICEYFELGFNKRSIKYLTYLRNEIKEVTNLAKRHFKAS